MIPRALGEKVHLAHPIGIKDLAERLIEESLPVLDARDAELGGKAQLEGEPREEPSADAVHGAHEGLRHLFCKEGTSTLDQSFPDTVAQFRGRLHRERGADDARGRHIAYCKRAL